MSDHFDRELFERAFSNMCGGCRRTCECGRVFFDKSNNGCTWNDGELEQLENDPNATGLGYAVSTMTVEGRTFVMDCNCWVERAKAIAKWLDGNGHGICNWFNLRKGQELVAAKSMPEVTP